MFNADKPIVASKEDLLGRSHFASSLSQAVLSFKQKDSLTIGLFGKWGSGKTSIINMFENELHLHEYSSCDERPIIIKFNPWNFSDQNQLIEQFFLALSNGLNLDNIKETLNQFSKGLEKVGQVFDIAKYIPVIAPVAQIVAPLIHDYAKVLKGSEEGKDLQKIKKGISDELLKINTKLIIIIDDIDRLNNLEIRQIFQLVKSLADFPNTVYLLPFDREVIIDALKDIQKGDGNEYLEKIIQIPIKIPNINIGKVHQFLFSKIGQIIFNYPENRFDIEYWSKIFGICVKPFISNLRDVNRLINIFSFKYDLVKDEVNVTDLIALSSLQVFAPEIHSWIESNKNGIVGGTNYSLGRSMNDQNQEKELLIEKVKHFTNLDPHLVIGILGVLFPAINQKVNFSYHHVTDKDLLRMQRVACLEKFDTYFSLSLDNIQISRREIEDIIFNYSSEQFVNKLKELNEKDMVINFLTELQSQIERLPIDRIPILLQAMINTSDILTGVQIKVIFEVSASRFALFIIRDLLKRYSDKTDRYNALIKAITDAPEEGISACAYLLNTIELTHGRLAASSSNPEEQLIDVNHLIEIEKLIVDKIVALSTRQNLLDLKGFRIIFYIWYCFDESNSKKYIQKMLFENNINVVKFIASNAQQWTSSDPENPIGWNFKSSDIEKFIQSDDVIDKISDLKKTTEFSQLDLWMQRRAVAFILWSEIKDVSESVNMSDVDNELISWQVT